MSVAQTLPNLPSYPLWSAMNQQTQNTSYTLEVSQTQITTAQLLLLKTTPIAITPTPAPGQTLWVDSIAIRYDFNSVAYTLNAGNLVVYYGPVANAHPITADYSAILTAAASRLIVNIPVLVVGPDTFANVQAQPLYMANNGAANYTLGNSSITVTVMFGRTTP